MNWGMVKYWSGALLGGFLLAAPLSVGAEIYKYVDLEGRITLTDKPMKGHHRLVSRTGSGHRKTRVSSVNMRAYKRNRIRYTPIIDETAARNKLHPALLHAVIRAESAYDPQALSPAGAVGLMQLMPATARRYGVSDRKDPTSNLDGGARYLRDLLQLFDDDLKLALAAYNAGENAVIGYGRKIPPYAETQSYVAKVLRFYEENQAGTYYGSAKK